MINKEKMNNYIKLNIIPTDLLRELAFKAIRSQGKGGQNVNKVATKIVLIFDLDNSSALNEDLKKLIKSKLGRRVDSKGPQMSKKRNTAGNSGIRGAAASTRAPAPIPAPLVYRGARLEEAAVTAH
jgi:protein subunit release factor B